MTEYRSFKNLSFSSLNFWKSKNPISQNSMKNDYLSRPPTQILVRKNPLSLKGSICPTHESFDCVFDGQTISHFADHFVSQVNKWLTKWSAKWLSKWCRMTTYPTNKQIVKKEKKLQYSFFEREEFMYVYSGIGVPYSFWLSYLFSDN